MLTRGVLLFVILFVCNSLQEYNLVVTTEKEAFMEIKYVHFEAGKKYQICCNNGTITPITAEHRSLHNGMPIYRVAVGNSTNIVGKGLACVTYEVGKKQYIGTKAIVYSPVQKPKGNRKDEELTVELVDSKQIISGRSNLATSLEPLIYLPDYMAIIAYIENLHVKFTKESKKRQKKLEMAAKNATKHRSKKRTGNKVSTDNLSIIEQLTKIHQESSNQSEMSDAKKLSEFYYSNLELYDYPIQQGIRAGLGGRKVYLSLTTSPKRLPFLHHVFAAIDTSLIDQIFVCIPKYFRNNSNETYLMRTELLKAFPKVRIIVASHDPGPCLKVTGSAKYLVEHGASPEDLLIYIDDDIAYSKTMVDTMLMLALTIPNSAIGGSGLNDWVTHFGFAPFPRQKRPLVEPALILEGFAAVIAPLKAIDYELILAFCDSLTPSCTFSDDLIMSWIFAYNGFPLYGITSNGSPNFYSKNSLRELPSANLGALKDKSHDNPNEKGFGGNFNRYNEASHLLFLTTLNLAVKGMSFKGRGEIIETLRKISSNQPIFVA